MKATEESTIDAETVLEGLKQEFPEAFDEMPELDGLSADQQVAAWYVAETCHVAAKQSGMTPHEVYDTLFEDRDFTLKLSINTESGEVQVEFIFDDEEEYDQDKETE